MAGMAVAMMVRSRATRNVARCKPSMMKITFRVLGYSTSSSAGAIMPYSGGCGEVVVVLGVATTWMVSALVLASIEKRRLMSSYINCAQYKLLAL